MDGNVTMDRRLRKRVRNLPTKQNYDPQEENTTLPHHYQRRHPPFPTNRNGPYHGTPVATWAQCHTNDSGSRMLTCSHLPPLFRHHHRPRHRTALPRLRLSMVWLTNKNDQRSRPKVHFTIRLSPLRKARNRMKPIHGIPPP